MSMKINIQSPSKKEIAEILRSIAKLIEVSSNETITMDMDLTFDRRK